MAGGIRIIFPGIALYREIGQKLTDSTAGIFEFCVIIILANRRKIVYNLDAKLSIQIVLNRRKKTRR